MNQKTKDLMFSSANEIWATPQDLFDDLNNEFGFTLDPCALAENAKCDRFFTPEINGLKQSWQRERVFCNPPYGRVLYDWVSKCSSEARDGKTLIVLLVPARTDTRWFHEFIWNKAEIRFIKGRLKFGGSKNSAPFPSMICIWNKNALP